MKTLQSIESQRSFQAFSSSLRCHSHASRNGSDASDRPIVWPFFGAVMALRYSTQALRVAASAPVLSILHFVISDGSQRGPTYLTAVRKIACLRPPMAYTVIKDRKQVEYNFTAIIRARARCALPMPMNFHPVARLHIPLDPETGAADSFSGWVTLVVLRVWATIV